jgi:hypothetical protein
MSSANNTVIKRRIVIVAVAVALLWASLGLDFGGSTRQALQDEQGSRMAQLKRSAAREGSSCTIPAGGPTWLVRVCLL